MGAVSNFCMSSTLLSPPYLIHLSIALNPMWVEVIQIYFKNVEGEEVGYLLQHQSPVLFLVHLTRVEAG
jgi:hypothetical protein